MQSKKQSMFEVIIGTCIGYSVALLTQIIVFPLFGLEVDLESNLLIGVIFTVVSITRGYFVRRLFNYLHRSKA